MVYVKREVYGETHEQPITVCPSREHGQGVVEICTIGKEAQEWWGEISINLDPSSAVELAEALLQAAKEAREAK